MLYLTRDRAQYEDAHYITEHKYKLWNHKPRQTHQGQWVEGDYVGCWFWREALDHLSEEILPAPGECTEVVLVTP